MDTFSESSQSNTDNSNLRKKSNKKDRSNHKLSEKDFKNLSREEQLSLAQIWWMNSKGFDEGNMFQFSYSHFSSLCQNLGFKKGVIDTQKYSNVCTESNEDSVTIFIERGRREMTVEKKITLARSTTKKMDMLLGSLSNIEKSKVIDALLNTILDETLEKKENGNFRIAYRAEDVKYIL